MTKKNTSSTSNAQRAIVSVVSGVVIIIIVLIAQAIGIDVLPEEGVIDTGGSGSTGNTGGEVITGNVGSANMVAIPGGYDGGWFQVYFTSPINSTNEADFHGAPIENALVAALNGAQTSIDAAFFEMNSQPVTDALISAHERGVRVRMVTDGDYGLDDPETTFDQIELAGIDVVSDGSRGGLMHDKFVVIDNLYVWTGSTNITHNGMYNNNNNAMLIRSNRLAANYTAEFEEMFGGSFGKTSNAAIPNPVVTVEGTQIETIFESEGDVPGRLIELLNAAHSVRFLTFSFTRDDIFNAILGHTNLDVKGVVESSQRSYIKPLYCGGIQVRQDGNPDILHDKLFILDDSIVVMGSFNFSASAADNNDENVLIIHNRDLANAYLEEFDRRWAEAVEIPTGTFGC